MSSPVTAQALSAPACSLRIVAVSLAPGETASESVSGWLCSPAGDSAGTVQVLVPGFTYNHSYWDFGFEPDHYSYLRYAVAAGYSVFLFDRLGTGASSMAPALSLTVSTHAWILHQLVTGLRAGRLGGHAFGKVVLVGHSLGSAISQTEASEYHDVDAVVLSGWLHTPLGVGTPGLIATTVPAQIDPRFAGRPLGYVTSLPGARAVNFYDAADSDPEVVATDEETKDTGTIGEEATVAATILPAVTLGITVPVLLATGQYDALFCGPLSPCTDAATVRGREGVFFSPPACLTAYVLPGSGHDMNLHLNAPVWFASVLAWLDEVEGASALPPPGCGTS